MSHPKTVTNPKGAGRPKGSKSGKRGRISPLLDKARSIIRPKIEANEPLSPHKLQDEHGISHVTFDMAITAEIARKQTLEEIGADTQLGKTAQQKLEAAIRQHQRNLELKFDQRVRDGIRASLEDMVLPSYNKSHRMHLDVIAGRRGVMDRVTYRKIWACLHPDRLLGLLQSDVEERPALMRRYAEAFDLFSSMEKRLLDEKESPTHFPPMPTTMAELDEARRRKREQDRVKRAARKGGLAPAL